MSAFSPFRSFNEIASYFKSSVSVISTNRWILLLPLFLALSGYLIKIPIWLYQRSEIQEIDGTGLENIFAKKISIVSIVETLVHSPNLFDYGFNGSIAGSIVFLSFFLICAITFKAESRKLQEYAWDNNIENVLYLEKILKIVLLIFVAFVFLFAITSIFQDQNKEFLLFVILGPGLMLIGILSLSLLSLIEGFILFSVKSILNQEELSFSSSLNKALSILRPLFYLNLLLSSFGYLSSLMMFPATLSNFLSVGQDPFFLDSLFAKLSSYLTYVNSIVCAITFCVPFVLIVNKGSVVQTLKVNFKFIVDHLINYLIFIGIGVIILSIPSILFDVLCMFSHPLRLYGMVVEIFIVTLRTSIAVIFYIGVFKYFLDICLTEVSAGYPEGPYM